MKYGDWQAMQDDSPYDASLPNGPDEQEPYDPMQFAIWEALKDQWEEYGHSTMTVAGIATDAARKFIKDRGEVVCKPVRISRQDGFFFDTFDQTSPDDLFAFLKEKGLPIEIVD